MSDTNIRKLYSHYFCEWLPDAGEENLLSLGDIFEERIARVISFKRRAEKEVGLLSEKSLARLVGESSEGMDDNDKAENHRIDQKFRELAKVAPAEIVNSKQQAFTMWALGLRPKIFADFDYWQKFDAFTLDELIWLSTGLSPRGADERKELQQMARLHVYPLAEIERRRNLLARAFPEAGRRNITATEFQVWASGVGLVWHSDFHTMIQNSADRSNQDQEVSNPTTDAELLNREIHPREFSTAAKIITAIAMDAYGYVPNQKRTKSTKDILNACRLAGLSVGNDTILKFLRAGDRQLED